MSLIIFLLNLEPTMLTMWRIWLCNKQQFSKQTNMNSDLEFLMSDFPVLLWLMIKCFSFTLQRMCLHCVDKMGLNLPHHPPELQCNQQLLSLISHPLIMTFDFLFWNKNITYRFAITRDTNHHEMKNQTLPSVIKCNQ